MGFFREIKLDTKKQWFISNLLVLCVPIFVCIMLWLNMQNSINKERIDKGHLQIKNITQNIENETAVNAITANYFKHNDAVKAAEELVDISSDTNKNIIRKLSESIDEYIYQTDLIDTIFIYLSASDTIVTADGYYTPYKYWKKYYANSNMGFTQWKETVQKRTDVEYKLYSLDFEDQTGAQYQSFLHTSIIRKNNDSNYSVIAVQNAKIVDYGNDVNETYFMIYDDSGEWIYTSSNLDKDTLPLLSHAKNNDKIKIGKYRYMVSYEETEKSGFRFVVASKLYNVFTDSFALVYAAVILISIFFCIWLLKKITQKNYTVIDRVVTSLRRFRGEVSSTNEAATIDYLIDKMLSETREHDRLLLKQKNQFVMLNVRRLLMGQIGAFEDVQNGLPEEDRLLFLSDYFVTIVIIVEDYKDFLGLGDEDAAWNAGNLVRFAIKNISEEVIGEKGNKAYFVDMEETAALLVSIASENLKTATEMLVENCKFIQTFLKQQLHIRTTITISGIGMGLYEIQAIYKQALEMAEYKYVLGEEFIITPDDLDIQEDVRYGYTHEREELLCNLLKVGDSTHAIHLIHDVLELEDEQKLKDVKRVQCMAYDIAATLIRFSSETKMRENSFNENDFLEAMLNAKNMENIKNLIIEAVECICDEQKNNEEDYFTKLVTDYIEKVYRDNSLSVSKIADHFHCHLAYMSSRFKEKMGIGMLEYINKLRINKSTELLLTTEYSVNDISEMVGYINVNTYIRVFKKIMGVTPNKYRNIKQ